MKTVDEHIRDAFLFARLSERIGFAAERCGDVAEAITAIEELAPELTPELAAAMELLCETQAAISRAYAFAIAKYETTEVGG